MHFQVTFSVVLLEFYKHNVACITSITLNIALQCMNKRASLHASANDLFPVSLLKVRDA